MDLTGLQTTSSVERFPWRDKRVALILVQADRIRYANRVVDKLDLLTHAGQGVVLAAWPGQWSQDIFVVDDIVQALVSL